MFDWNQFVEIIFAYSVAALLLERSLYQVFDSKLWKSLEKWIDDVTKKDAIDLKPWISVAISVTVAIQLDLDVLAFMFDKEPQTLTIVLTGLFISGGSTGVYKFLKRARELKERTHRERIDGAGDGN